jgi:uncharacterized membrane protein (DUF485 family)
MIASVGVILLVFGFVCALLAAFLQPQPPGTPIWGRVHLGWLAIAFLIAAMIFGGLKL